MVLYESYEGKNVKIEVPDTTDFSGMIENFYKKERMEAKPEERDGIKHRTPQYILNVIGRPEDNAHRREMRHRVVIDSERNPGQYQKVLQQAAQKYEDARYEKEFRDPDLYQKTVAIIRKRLPPKQAEMLIAIRIDKTETIKSWAAKYDVKEESVKRQLKRIRSEMNPMWFKDVLF